jgi:small subunit ribosomal protein S20
VAQHKSAEKRNRQSQKRRERNTALTSRMRGAIKDARSAVEAKKGDKDAVVKNAVSEINRAASKNVLTKRTASRYVSRLMRAAQAAR